MLASGVPLEVVSRVLGHAGIAITLSTYAEVVPELHRDAASALDRMLA
jgi:integrase